jgi:hypothetical protein
MSGYPTTHSRAKSATPSPKGDAEAVKTETGSIENEGFGRARRLTDLTCRSRLPGSQ